MTISFQCTGCGRTLKVGDHLAGRKAKCPQCKAVLFIPEGEKSAVTTAPAPTRKKPAAAPPVEEPDETREDAADEPADEPRERRGSKKKGKKAKKSLLLPLLLVGGGVLFLLCAGGGGFALWWFWPAAAPEDAYFYPDNAQLVAQVQMDQLLASGAIQQARQEFPDFNQKVLAQFAGPSGALDTSNLGPAYVVSQAMTPGATQPNLIAIQRFKKPTTVADVQAGVKKNDPAATFTETKVGRFTVYDYQATNASTGRSEPVSFLMADSQRQVAGPTSLLHTILERDKKVDLPDKLQAMIKQTDFKATVAIVGGRDFAPKTGLMPAMPGPNARPGAPPAPAANPLDKVEGWSVTANVGNDVDLTVSATCTDPQAANDLRDNVKKTADQLNGLLKFAALAGNKVPPEVSDLLDLNPQVSNATVSVTKKVQVGPLMQYAKEQQQQQQKPPGIVLPLK